jgi:hypothetical protein
MSDIAERLQVRTQSLLQEIEWIKASHSADAQVVLEHLRHVRSELALCGDLLRTPEFLSGDTVAQRSALGYRDCLQRLQDVLPILQSDLLAQRSQLRPQQDHVDAATEWLHCNNSTLG